MADEEVRKIEITYPPASRVDARQSCQAEASDECPLGQWRHRTLGRFQHLTDNHMAQLTKGKKISGSGASRL